MASIRIYLRHSQAGGPISIPHPPPPPWLSASANSIHSSVHCAPGRRPCLVTGPHLELIDSKRARLRDVIPRFYRGFFEGAFAKLRRASVSFVVSVLPSVWNNSALTERICMKFYIWGFFEYLSLKLKFHYNRTKITGALHEDRYTFLIISHSVLLRMRNVWEKSCRENQNTHFVSSNFFSQIVPSMR